MPRVPLPLLVGVILALGAIACSDNGDYQIQWQFASADGTGEPQEAAAACGAHGVDAILVTGTGSGDTSASGLCAAGEMVRSAPVGSWRFEVHTLDVWGRRIHPDGPEATTEMREITEGGRTVYDVVLLTPRTECADSVDNDRDGRVDLADLDCADASGISEMPLAPPAASQP